MPSSTSSASFGTTSSKVTDLIRISRNGCQAVPWRRPKCLGSFAGKAVAPPLQLAPAPSRRGVRAIAGAGCLPNVAVPPNLDRGFLAAPRDVEQVAAPIHRLACVGGDAIVHARSLFADVLDRLEEGHGLCQLRRKGHRQLGGLAGAS